jgi:hypothetical protein
MRGGYFFALVILMSVISVGCGGGNSTHLDVAAGHLAVVPSTLNFGNVAVGQAVTRTGTLKAGNASIKVTSADWKGEGYSITGITFPFMVAAGQSVSFTVTFAPQKSGQAPGNISFLSEATNSPNAETFSANAVQAGGIDQTSSPQGAHSVSLSWQASNYAVAYNIYRRTQPKAPFTRVNTTPQSKATFTDTSVQGGQTYFYVTTAVNNRGTESKFSNQIHVTVPNS